MSNVRRLMGVKDLALDLVPLVIACAFLMLPVIWIALVRFSVVSRFVNDELTAIVAGTLLCPLVPALAPAVGSAMLGGNFASALGLSVVFYPFALVATVVLGGPLFLAFRRLRLVRWWSALASGSIAGCVVVMVLSTPSVESLCLFALQGALAGFVFWLLWRLGMVRGERVHAGAQSGI